MENKLQQKYNHQTIPKQFMPEVLKNLISELASTSGEALGEAFKGLAEGTGQVTKTLGDQSRKIVNKKYGEDYVKTFIPDEKNQKEEGYTPVKEEESQEDTKPLYPSLEEKK